jgi:hypothetical protein
MIPISGIIMKDRRIKMFDEQKHGKDFEEEFDAEFEKF